MSTRRSTRKSRQDDDDSSPPSRATSVQPERATPMEPKISKRSMQKLEVVDEIIEEMVEETLSKPNGTSIPPPAKIPPPASIKNIPPPAKSRAVSVEPIQVREETVGKQTKMSTAIVALTALAALSGGAFLHQNPHHIPEPVRQLPNRMPEHWEAVKSSLPEVNLPEWPLMPNVVPQDLKERVGKGWEATTEAVKSGLDTAKDRANQVSEGTRKVAAEALGKTRENLAYHGSNVKDKAGAAIDSVRAGIQGVLDSLPTFDLGGKATKELQERLIALEAKIEEQLEKLSTRDEVERELANFQQEVKSIQNMVKEVGAQLQEEVGEKLSKLDQDHKATEEKLKSTDDKIKTNEEKLSQVVWEMEKRALEAVERHLPARLFVRKDPKTGKVDFDPEFWQTLKEKMETTGLTRPLQVVVPEEGLEGDAAKVAQAAAQQTSERLMKEFMNVESISKDQVLELIRGELQKTVHSSVSRGSGQDLSGKDGEFLMSGLQQLVDKKLERFAADTIAMPDYALSSAGAQIIPELTSSTYEKRPNKPISGLLSRALGVGMIEGRPPSEAISRGNNMGECWAMKGSNGYIGIQLAHPAVLPTAITIEHVPLSVALGGSRGVTSAPRNIEVLAIYDLDAFKHDFIAKEEKSVPEGAVKLVEFEYDPHRDGALKTIPVGLEGERSLKEKLIEEMKRGIGAVMIQIKSNHGNPDFTCLYRVRVHGTDN